MTDYQRIDTSADIRFTQEEWRVASDLAAKLLEALGAQSHAGCQVCNPPRILLPNYAMKYELAKALFPGASR